MNPRSRCLALFIGLCSGAALAEDFSFDAAEFDQKPFEFGGHLELKTERGGLNPDSSFYRLGGLDRATLDRQSATLKLNAKYTHGIASVHLRANAEAERDSLDRDWQGDQRFDEAYLSFKPDPGLALDIGKQSIKWGKGYAWNPVGFIERPKDANDVELAREGFTLVAADFIRNLDGDLKTVAFTPVLLPVNSQMNSDFGAAGFLNPAAKLYLLYRDTDIDFTWLGRGSRTPRFGVDFSRNLSSALEIHGEWARIADFEQRRLDAAGNPGVETRDATSYLFGLRYLTDNDTTWIAELYRNGTGYTERQLGDFHHLVDSANPLLLNPARQLAPSYGRPSAGERYAYLRASQKEPFDIVYFTPSVTLIANLDDGSFSLTPELLYTGITNLDLRLRASWLHGKEGSEFGEKQNARRLELMGRWYF